MSLEELKKEPELDTNADGEVSEEETKVELMLLFFEIVRCFLCYFVFFLVCHCCCCCSSGCCSIGSFFRCCATHIDPHLR